MTAPALVGAQVIRPVGRLRRIDPVLLVSGSLCALLVVVAVVGRWIAPYDPELINVLAASQGPSGAHLLGTDSLGRDILSRLLAGARLSFAGPGLIMLLSITLGTTLGVIAAWFGGWVDTLLAKTLNVMFAVPGILVAIIAAAVFGAGFWAPVLALALVYIPYVARIVRSAAVTQCNMAYIETCKLAGMSTWRICALHVLPNISPLILAQATIGFGSALMDFGATSFIGVGVQPPTAEWGVMVSDGRTELLDGAFQQSLAAGLLIVVSVVAFNVLGERIATRMGVGR